MARVLLIMTSILLTLAQTTGDKKLPYPAFDYDTAQTHEIKPHRRNIPHQGVRPGFTQLQLKLIVSPGGEVLSADAQGDKDTLRYWPDLETEVSQWKFEPFKENGVAVTAEVEEYIDLVPPERLPKTHVAPPVLHPESKVQISIQRSGCYGSCPSYKADITTEGILFKGDSYVVAAGKHTDTIDPDAARKLAKRFIDADFYSMDKEYVASVTDSPTYILTLSIDGHSKEVLDYVGEWEGMPGVITDLEETVDSTAKTDRWIRGTEGLVALLQAEKFDFKTFDAQVMLKEAARRGQAVTVGQMLAAGVPLKPLPAPRPKNPNTNIPFAEVGWLSAASNHPEVLQLLIQANASAEDQKDKDLVLDGAARYGSLSAVRSLIAYGANPNVNLSKLTVTQEGGGMVLQGPGAGSILIDAASSGNPDVLAEILRYHPKLEARDREGKTAIFAAGDYRSTDVAGARVKCVRLLAEAGSNVNAKDSDGNTPLHETFLTDVEEELLKLGADVNARNADGETPIFTTADDDAMSLFIRHGADLNIRNKKSETVVEAAASNGPLRQEALRKAIQEKNQVQ